MDARATATLARVVNEPEGDPTDRPEPSDPWAITFPQPAAPSQPPSLPTDGPRSTPGTSPDGASAVGPSFSRGVALGAGVVALMVLAGVVAWLGFSTVAAPIPRALEAVGIGGRDFRSRYADVRVDGDTGLPVVMRRMGDDERRACPFVVAEWIGLSARSVQCPSAPSASRRRSTNS